MLPAGTPPRAREVLRRCLRKDADERPRDIRDVRLELAEAGSGAGRGEGYQLWSERHDREMTDVFELHDEIANAIATRLRVSMRGDAENGRGRWVSTHATRGPARNARCGRTCEARCR